MKSVHELQGDEGDSEIVSRFLNTCACASLGVSFTTFIVFSRSIMSQILSRTTHPPTPTSEAPGGEPRDLKESQNLFTSEQGFLVVLSIRSFIYLFRASVKK